MSSLSLSMNALGATVPLSAGFLLMCRKSERSAERSVGGDGGMGIAWGTWGLTVGASETEDVRTGFLRELVDVCGGWLETAAAAAAGGRGGSGGMSGTEGSGY